MSHFLAYHHTFITDFTFHFEPRPTGGVPIFPYNDEQQELH